MLAKNLRVLHLRSLKSGEGETMKRFFNILAYVLVIVGALNWGLWGFFQFDLVAWLFGGNTVWLSRLVYAIVGLAGLWMLGCFGTCCSALCGRQGESPCCHKKSSECAPEQKKDEDK
jgi:uncharacterized protein